LSGFGHGQRRSKSDAPQKPPSDPEAVAREVCLRLLTVSPKTRSQLAEALAKKLVPDEVAEQVLGRFSEVGLIDDEAFAQAWVRSRSRSKGLAPRALAQELRKKGVDDETVKDAVAEIMPEDEESAAREQVDRKLRSTQGLDRDKRTRRLVGMLARKGYAPGLAYRVVKEALADEGVELQDLVIDE